jgi:hypothetical protein
VCSRAVEYPGRGGRLRERLRRTIHELVGVLLTPAASALIVNQFSRTRSAYEGGVIGCVESWWMR